MRYKLVDVVKAGALCALVGLSGSQLKASVFMPPASDPVSIARSGAGVAYGNSLEAASANPGILATLRNPSSAFFACGTELHSSQATLQSSDNNIIYSDDKSRYLSGIGAAWRLNPVWTVGLKLDRPFLLHASMPIQYTGRFTGRSLNVSTTRMEAQLGWAASPKLAFGVSLGTTYIQHSWASDGKFKSEPLSDIDFRQSSSKYTPSYSVGLRWALNPDWTIGIAYAGPIKANLSMREVYQPYGIGKGVSNFDQNTDGFVSKMIFIPSKMTVGIRQRVNPLFTWEVDTRYVYGSKMAFPESPTSDDLIIASRNRLLFKNSFGISLMGEINITKHMVIRLGSSLDTTQLHHKEDISPLRYCAPLACFSGGLGYKMFGGELSLGYQFRKSHSIDTKDLDGIWINEQYITTRRTVRVEGMGHIVSIGFKKVI